ncbi:MOSC domain-containing protein [Sandaracinobacteroides saxicola]|uniref:MOSC domain-containing protein n=1 Tax=Sandaracinobacteroides saxicola TaxID=2759707 RepID=A0A7G5IHI6_9SPHN|nr:MOSC domain-containing protein [Sandaracinobacteroides saxicola]QMW22828.1 MOSC domain-containing protein [Sandaracinobacteroides saxicola]
MTSPSLLELRIGRAVRFGKTVTAYGKQPVQGPLAAHQLGLVGDQQANQRVHGGPEKAIYAYAASNYPHWVAEHPRHADRLVPGGFGENLLVAGLDETTVHIGDRWRIGSVVLEVCQPRQPCNTLARWYGDPAMVKAMIENGRSGWYNRVAEPGQLAAGDVLTWEERLPGAWSIAQVLRVSYADPPDSAALEALAAHPRLAKSWATWAARLAKAAR